MKYAIILLFVFAGLINAAPLVGALSADHLSKLYAVDIIDKDIALLLRHRAFLFGIVGALILCAAVIPGLRLAATLAGLVSMVSYMVLIMPSTQNAALLRIAWIDVAATAALILGYLLHVWTTKP